MPAPYTIHNQVICPWVPEEEQRLFTMKGSTKEESLEAFPNRTWSAIRGKAKKLKIRKLVRRIPWDTGLSKETDSRVRDLAKKTSKRRIQLFSEGRIVTWNKGKHIDWNRTNHDQLLLEEVAKLEAQGFRCIPLVKVLPDAIAIKDGKVYAVELETFSPDYDKYQKVDFYDDVIWIVILKRGHPPT